MSEPALQSEENMEVEASENGRIGRWLAVLARLILVAFMGVALGVGAYLGAPALLRAWMEPIEANQARITQLERQVERLGDQQEGDLDRLSNRVAELEGETAAQGENLAELTAGSSELAADFEGLAQELDDLARLDERLDQLDERTNELQLAVAQLEEMDSEPAAELQELAVQLDRMQALILISRARFELLQGNAGLARENLEQAQAVFEGQLLAEDDPITEVLQRLELAGQALPNTPGVAAQDLEAAWRLLANAGPGGAQN